MTTIRINIKIDSELKQQAKELFDDLLGVDFNTGVTILLKQAVRKRSIPICQDPLYSKIAQDSNALDFQKRERNIAAYEDEIYNIECIKARADGRIVYPKSYYFPSEGIE